MPFGVYHINNSGKTSYYNFISKLAKEIGYHKKIIKVKDSDFPSMAPKPLKTAMSSLKLPPIRSWQNALSDYTKSIKIV